MLDVLPLLRDFLVEHPRLGLAGAAITPLAGDVSSRRYFRVCEGDHSAIVCLYPAPFDEKEGAVPRLLRLCAKDEDTPLKLANDPLAHLEATRVLEEAGLPVPRVMAVDGARALMVFEDLGDVRLQEVVAGQEEASWPGWYRSSLALIYQLQALTPGVVSAGLFSGRLALDGPKLSWEMDYFIRETLEGWGMGRLNGPQVAQIRQDLHHLCQWIHTRPRVLCHRDYHARNLMVVGGRLFVIDHQDMRLGPITYDVASLLEDPYVTPPPALAARLWEEFRTRVAPLDAEFERERRRVTIQRLIKAAGTYGAQVRRGVRSFEVYLVPTLLRAVTLLREDGEYEATASLLEGVCQA